jgi:hypothetical protein
MRHASVPTPIRTLRSCAEAPRRLTFFHRPSRHSRRSHHKIVSSQASVREFALVTFEHQVAVNWSIDVYPGSGEAFAGIPVISGTQGPPDPSNPPRGVLMEIEVLDEDRFLLLIANLSTDPTKPVWCMDSMKSSAINMPLSEFSASFSRAPGSWYRPKVTVLQDMLDELKQYSSQGTAKEGQAYEIDGYAIDQPSSGELTRLPSTIHLLVRGSESDARLRRILGRRQDIERPKATAKQVKHLDCLLSRAFGMRQPGNVPPE